MAASHSNKTYWAFISYSSKDRKWGQWLHKRLENYPIPKEFQGAELSEGVRLGKYLRPVFRDRDELAGSSNLGPAILNALQESRYLIVLCSPNSAKSAWVNKEIEDFKRLCGEENILALILDGVPNASSGTAGDPSLECFPPALRYPAEPLAGDLRKEGDGRQRGFLKVLSGISQLDFDSLYRRHERAQRNRRMLAGGFALSIIVTLSGLSWFAFDQKAKAVAQSVEAVRARNEARAELASSLLFQGQAAISGGAFRDALPPLVRATDLYSEIGGRPAELERLLRIAVDKNHLIADFRAHQEAVALSQFNPDGTSLLTTTLVYGELAVWDTESWKHRFTKSLDNLRHAALSGDAKSVITIQSQRGDEPGKPAATHWNRWSATDGSLLESMTIPDLSAEHFPLTADRPMQTYQTSNQFSRKTGEPVRLEIRSTNSNERIAEFEFNTEEFLSGFTYLPDSGLLIIEKESGTAVTNRSSDITGERNLTGAEKYLGDWLVSDDGKRLFGRTRNDGGRWLVWDISSGDLVQQADGKPNLSIDMDGIAFSDDGAFITTMSNLGFAIRKVDLGYWDIESPEKVRTVLADGIHAVAASSNLQVRELTTGLETTYPTGTRDSWRIDLHLATRRLVSFDRNGRVMVFELTEAELLPVPGMESRPIALMRTSEDRSQALLRTAENDIIVWDVDAEREVSRLQGTAVSKDSDFEWLPGANRLLTRDSPQSTPLEAKPQTIRVHDTGSGEKLLELGDSFAWGLTPDGRTLLAMTRKGLALHPVSRTGGSIPLREPVDGNSELSSQAGFSSDSSLVAIATSNGKVVLHDVMTGELRKSFDLGRPDKEGWIEHSFSAVHFHSDDRGLLVGSNMGTSFLIDLATGEVQTKPQFRMEHNSYFSLQDEGRMLIHGSHNPVRFHRFPGLEAISTFAGNCERITVFPRESRFFSEYRYGEMVFGDLSSGLEIHTFENPIAASPHHGLVAVRGDSDIRILDFRTSKSVKTTPADFINDGFFSSDARFLYPISSDGILLKLEVSSTFDEILHKARFEAPR
jgi:WD40 repeat protein